MRTIRTMQPRPVSSLPTGRGWTYETKLDGFRAVAVKQGRVVRLLSRTQTDLSRRFGRIVADIARLPSDQLILDGEIVALDADGRPSFVALQDWYRRIPGERYALAYYVFDVLEVDGRSLMQRPLSERRRRLVPLVRGDTLLVSPTLPGSPDQIERQVRAWKLEGIVAKRSMSRYQPGTRSRDWVKLRFDLRDSFVIGGYLPSGVGVGSLLVGQYHEGRLHYSGTVDAGLVSASRAAILKRLDVSSFRWAACPFVDLPHHTPYRRAHPWDERVFLSKMSTIRFVPPSVVIEVAYLGWTRHRLLRDARFIGIREDKAAHAVQQELEPT